MLRKGFFGVPQSEFQVRAQPIILMQTTKLIVATGVIALFGAAALVSAADAQYPSGTQARDMEQLATPSQVAAFIQRIKRDCYVFGEDRVNSIRRHDALPAHWLDGSDAQLERFSAAPTTGG